MIYLILSVLASSLIFVIFKLFAKYQVDTLQAIIVNYLVACISGLVAYSEPIDFVSITNQGWFYGTMILGIIFISVFNLMAITTQKNGLSVAAVATKMSVAIPIVFGIIVYKESTGALKIIGIIIALLAVYMTSMKNAGSISIKKENLIYPLLVFIGSGIIDTSLKFLETHYIAKTDVPIFSASIFGFAAIVGVTIIIYKALKGTLNISIKNIIAGICLGVPNYFSIYFLIKALRYDGMDSSSVFTINNVAILLVSTIAGIMLFKEKLILKNWIGIILAIISILLVAFSI
ncbi:EamA/RhaT family transporter [Aquimarina sp. MMG016]|uniref:EamA family transporter n=1 Tax=Aquimarina sp. MMG016 TaxID=2822690 RepID=UPI001B3A3FE4|nr:EamA/RhaT family transporter [Aquimarina sp. MMG016]MBQ4821191.1 EamA/RhaT family transporter [Aquimarina sp. MMG016]